MITAVNHERMKYPRKASLWINYSAMMSVAFKVCLIILSSWKSRAQQNTLASRRRASSPAVAQQASHIQALLRSKLLSGSLTPNLKTPATPTTARRLWSSPLQSQTNHQIQPWRQQRRMKQQLRRQGMLQTPLRRRKNYYPGLHAMWNLQTCWPYSKRRSPPHRVASKRSNTIQIQSKSKMASWSQSWIQLQTQRKVRLTKKIKRNLKNHTLEIQSNRRSSLRRRSTHTALLAYESHMFPQAPSRVHGIHKEAINLPYWSQWNLTPFKIAAKTSTTSIRSCAHGNGTSWAQRHHLTANFIINFEVNIKGTIM